MGVQSTVSGRTYSAVEREQALAEYYRLELRACGCPVEATERMGDYAKRLDALEAERAR